jgi:predicted GIY-YIG superfamily endonuclease
MRDDSAKIVYVLRSQTDPARHYTGITSDLRHRLEWHNSGPSGCTVHYRPWSVVVAIEFADARVARRFERYLKSGSCRAFSQRHVGPI